MAYRRVNAAPASQVAPERRGAEAGIFCLACGNVYPLHRSHHRGKPAFGKDHVAAPCAHEGDSFRDGADWWEPAVEILPAAEPSAAES